MVTTATSPKYISTPLTEAPRNNVLVWLALVCIVLFALALRAKPLGRGLGEDELFTAVNFVDVPSLRPTLTDLGAFNNHIGYSLAARIAEHIFGRSEETLRLPALLFGLGSLVCMFLLCRLFVGTGFALFASLLLSISPPHIAWSVEARGYSGMMFFSLWSSYLFIRLIGGISNERPWIFVIANVAAIYIHLYSTFVVVAQMVLFYWLWRRGATNHVFDVRSKRTIVNSFIAIVVGSISLYAPAARSFLTFLVGRGRSAFNPFFPLVALKYLSGTDNTGITILVAAVAGIGCFKLGRQAREVLIYSLVLLIGPLGLMWVIRPLDLYPRFFGYWLPFYILIVTCGLRFGWSAGSESSLQRKSLQALAVAVILAVTANWMLTWQSWVADEGYREVSRAAQVGAVSSTGFCAIGGSRSIWKYYIKKPVATPTSLSDLQQWASTYSEIRCLYYKASWQDDAQTQIADFLFQHALWWQYNGHNWFLYRSEKSMTARPIATKRE